MRIESKGLKTLAYAWCISLSLQINIPFASAEDSTPAASPTPIASPTPTIVSLDDFDAVCGTTLNPPSDSTPVPAQKLTYCQASKSAKEAGKTNGILWKVWSAVAGVCVAACTSSFIPGLNFTGSEYVCPVVNTGAAITDAIMVKNLTQVMISIGASGAGIATNLTANSYLGKAAEKRAKEKLGELTKEQSKEAAKKAKRDLGACMIAASNAYQIYTNVSKQKENNKVAKEQLNLAAALASDTPPGGGGGAVTPPAGTPNLPGTGGITGASPSTVIGLQNQDTPVDAGAAICGQAVLSTSDKINCAAATDMGLPNTVGSPEFADMFHKASGTDLGDFLNSPSSPIQSVVDAASGGGGLYPDQGSQLASALGDLMPELLNPDSAYSSGGYAGGGGSGGGDGTDAAMAMFSGMMNQMQRSGGDGKKSELTTLNYEIAKIANRSPAGLPEDRTVSLFARVTSRYFVVWRNGMSSNFNLPQNGI